MKRSSHHAIRIIALSKCAMVILLMLIGGSAMTPGVSAQAAAWNVATNGSEAKPQSEGIPLTFIENVGQFDTSVRFQASNGNTTLLLTDGALWVSLTDLPPQADPVSEAKTLGAVAGADETGRQVNLKLSFSGANPHPRLEPFEEQAVKVSFLTGADPAQWRADVPAWAGVRYADLYPGIDLEITGQNGQLTPRLVVREPASLQNVRLRVEGADALAVKGNHLRLTTPLGNFALPLLTVEGADPKIEPAISVVDGVQQVVAPFASTSSPAIDMTSTGTPALLYSTYLGGNGTDQASDIALDSAGNVYIIGRTYSTDLPTTPGAYDISQNGAYDVFVTKMSADGGTLLYSTYLGGSNEDIGTGIAVDSAGNAYLTGHTYSTDFPTTPGASDTMLNGGRDGFVAKLNAAGNGLVYSTYLGGDSWDYGQSIALDDSGSAYVGGFTHGSFPVTTGAAQTVFGGMGDGFATKFSPDGRTVLYSTYIGGNSWEGANGIAVDHAGHAYLATGTASTDYPTTPGAWDRTCDNCSTNYSTDGAVAKLNADGSAFIYSTLIGGADAPASDWFADIAVDSAGNAYLTGATSSTDFPTTPNALQRSFRGGEEDIVVVKLTADGSGLLYSTYLGGSGADRGYSIAIDGNGNAYVTGFTASTNLPTVNPLQAANAGGYDAFLAVVNTDASALLYSSYLGGSGDENRESSGDGYADIALDPTRQTVHLTGYTASTDFPTTANAYDRSFNGGASDAFVTGLSVTTGPWHVATNGSDTTGNGSEAQPFATIQHGIDTASHGDTVLVHPGVYRENINFNGKNITVGSLFITTGNENYIFQTVIDGNRNGRVVTFVNGEAATAQLSGFTITNGYAHGTSEPETYGGGVYCRYSNPTLTHLRVTGNEADESGGGLHLRDCSTTIRDIIVTNNHADNGGGIRYTGGSLNLENVVVSHNSATHGGSGLFFYHADGTVKNALVADNSGGGKGGGLGFDGCSPTFTNVTIVGNRTTGHGGGLNVSFMSQPTLVNSIVWGNTPEQIYYDTDWGGEAITIEYSDIEGGQAGIVTNGLGPVHWGEGNLEVSPRFVHTGLGNYRLADNSPAIGAGKADAAPSTDIEGNPRPNPAGSNPDMGAYENPLGTPPPSTFKVYLPFMHNAPRSAEGLYFVRGDVLYQMNLDGSDLRSVAQGLQGNQYLAADPIHQKIYAVRWGQSAQIQVFDLDARALKVYSDGPGDGGQGLAIDPAGHKMYHGLYYDGVYAMDMNAVGTWTRLVDPASLAPMYGQRGQLQVDPVNRHIYFRSTFNGECGLCRYIWRVGFDGDGLVQIIKANSGGDALALDLTEQKMYFSDELGNVTVTYNDTIKRANLDGSAVETLLTIPEPYRLCSSMALDMEHQKMYLNLSTDDDDGYKGKAIARANMDGSEFEILHMVSGNTEDEVHGGMALSLPVLPVPEPPLLMRYDFEGDFLTSGTITDRSGNGHDAHVSGTVAQAAGISGDQGISFTGSGYIQAAGNPAAGKTNVTFSLWFKTEHPENNYKLASGAWWNWGPGSGWIMATHGPEFWSDDTQGLLLPGQPNNENNFAISEWIHEVVTYDGSRIKEYTNGQLINDWSTTGAAIGQGNPMVVGAWPPFTAYNFQGSMDEFVIYDRSLTQQEVQALYNRGK